MSQVGAALLCGDGQERPEAAAWDSEEVRRREHGAGRAGAGRRRGRARPPLRRNSITRWRLFAGCAAMLEPPSLLLTGLMPRARRAGVRH